MNKKIAYLRDRIVNALWMLREGKFRLILKSIRVEVAHRIDAMRTWYRTRREIPESQVPWSRFVNRARVVPPSYRPTVMRRVDGAPLRADAQTLAAELRRHRSTLTLPSGVDE